MNNLDWSNVEDEKDKRIRELEDTLRKQKELMEILQVLGKNASIWCYFKTIGRSLRSKEAARSRSRVLRLKKKSKQMLKKSNIQLCSHVL